jgi:hypothetical protein
MVRSPAASPLHGYQQPPDQPRSAVHAYISGLKLKTDVKVLVAKRG